MTRRHFIIGAVALQIVFLLVMAGQREWIARTGKVVILATAPIDPQDPMRGDYAHLDYDFSRIARSLCRDGLVGVFEDRNNVPRWRDKKVYGTVHLDPNGVGEIVALSDRQPSAGIFMRGRIIRVDGNELNVRWGVEALFMQQGKARALEDERRTTYSGTPLHVAVAVSPSGTSVLKNFNWAPLGMTLAMEMEPALPIPKTGPRPPPPSIIAVTVELKNMSHEPIAIIDLPDQQSFRLVTNGQRQFLPDFPQTSWIGENQAVSVATAKNIRVLQPGETFHTRLDLSQPRWFVQTAKSLTEISPPEPIRNLTDANANWFRIEYAPPIPTNPLTSSAMIQYTRLASRGFAPRGRID